MSMWQGSRVKGVKGPRARGRPFLGPGAQPSGPSAPRPLGPSAFTLIELLIVIAVIGILIAVIGLVGVKVVYHQRVAQTEATMRTVKLAIDQFKENNPLANIYDRKESPGTPLFRPTFGAYPPYMLAGWQAAAPASVQTVLEPAFAPPSYTLYNRLWNDMCGGGSCASNLNLVDPNEAHNDDIRALYTYLRLYVPDALSQVPSSALKPLTTSMSEYVNPNGTSTVPGAPGTAALFNVLGIFDAWGVPMDYFLYVKLEWVLPPGGTGGQWRVADRVPVLRSLGISHEEYVAEMAGTDAPDPQLWILSDPFPSPAAAAVNKFDGSLSGTGSTVAGWARAKAAGDDYDYVP